MATQLYDDFRRNVTAQMRKRKLTQTALAEGLGVSPGYISQLLGGKCAEKRGVGLETVEKIAQILSVKPDSLLSQPSLPTESAAEEFASHVRKQSELQGIPISEVAERVGLTLPDFRRILSGKQVPSINLAGDIAQVLGFKIALEAR